jgi:hypothetical protein
MGAVLYERLRGDRRVMAEQLGLLDEDEWDFRDPLRDGLAIRESRRARHLSLQLVPPHTLEVVVPRGTRPRAVEAFVRENRSWIERARAELASRFRGDREELPRRVGLAAVGRDVPIEYDFRSNERPRWEDDGTKLCITCIHGARASRALLREWFMHQARSHLKPWLLSEAERVGERPRAVQVRLQRTRWGSCSGQRTISVNAALLLLEPKLVRYLMVHELCHLRWMSHSRRYWRLVERFEPDFRLLDRDLADAWTLMPLWIMQARNEGAC